MRYYCLNIEILLMLKSEEFSAQLTAMDMEKKELEDRIVVLQKEQGSLSDALESLQKQKQERERHLFRVDQSNRTLQVSVV